MVKQDYSDFYDALDLDFGSLDIRSRGVLRNLMRNNGYRVVRNSEGELENKSPSQLQLDFAWDYLKHGFVEKEGIKKLMFVEFTDKWGNTRYRNVLTGRFMKKEDIRYD